MFCSQCGTEANKGARFCGSCGSRLDEAQPRLSDPAVQTATCASTAIDAATRSGTQLARQTVEHTTIRPSTDTVSVSSELDAGVSKAPQANQRTSTAIRSV